MKIDIKEIQRINIKENEILLIKVPSKISQKQINDWTVMLENEFNLKGRVLIVSSEIDLSIISKKVNNEKNN
jgi:hypothetical protein